jgi:hypothetical protein
VDELPPIEEGVMDSKRKVVAGVAGLALLAGAGGVYAATNKDSNERKAFTDDVAKRLDVTPQKLNDAVQGAFADRLDAAVKAGKLTQKQADEIKQRVKERGGIPFGGPGLGPEGPDGPKGPGFGFGRHGGPFISGFDAAAKYLGISDRELKTQLGSGKSLADVAKAKGKSTGGLKQAMRDSLKASLDKAVKSKDLTAAEEKDMLKGFDDHASDLISGKPPAGGERFHRFRGGPPGAPDSAPAPFGKGAAGGPPAPPPLPI